MPNQIIQTDDGSNTVLASKFGVTYHSRFGALEECITVFLSAGLQYQLMRSKPDISVFEMGFGTGFNAFLTYLQHKRQPSNINYTGIELYPISLDQAAELAYPQLLNAEEEQVVFEQMHKAKSGKSKQFSPGFSFTKILGDIHEIDLFEQFDVIYYDAFAPTTQEDLWTEEIMHKLYKLTASGGVLVTYCAKGSFKRALKAAGYQVESLPGPGRKREMTRAIKSV